MRKTLGGDRLGGGKKMKVDLKGYERSTHNLDYIWRSSMTTGTLVPFMCEVALPGDTHDIELDIDIKTLPTVGPLFGSFDVHLDIFTAPIRLYSPKLHNNSLYVGLNMQNVQLPQMKKTIIADNNSIPLNVNLDSSQVNGSCILNYLGIRGYGRLFVGDNNREREFNAVPLLAYWEIYKNYYSNKQEEEGVVIHYAEDVPTYRDWETDRKSDV